MDLSVDFCCHYYFVYMYYYLREEYLSWFEFTQYLLSSFHSFP
jgi:hypothetical protein